MLFRLVQLIRQIAETRNLDFVIFHLARMLLPVTALDEIERAGAHVGEIKRQLDFAMDFRRVGLIVPGVAVPAVKVAFRRQRLPALCFSQFVVRAEVPGQDLFDRGMQREINETLIELQHVLDHVAIALGFLITVNVVPAQPAQAARKGALHVAKLSASRRPGKTTMPFVFSSAARASTSETLPRSPVASEGNWHWNLFDISHEAFSVRRR